MVIRLPKEINIDHLKPSANDSRKIPFSSISITNEKITDTNKTRRNIRLNSGPSKGYALMSKDKLREKIKHDTEQFILNGGTITQLPRGESEVVVSFQDKTKI